MSASAWAQTDTRTAERLLRASGLWAQLKSLAQQVPADMRGAAQQGGAEVTAAGSASIGREVDLAYASPRLRATATAVLARQIQAGNMQACNMQASHIQAGNMQASNMQASEPIERALDRLFLDVAPTWAARCRARANT